MSSKLHRFFKIISPDVKETPKTIQPQKAAVLPAPARAARQNRLARQERAQEAMKVVWEECSPLFLMQSKGEERGDESRHPMK